MTIKKQPQIRFGGFGGDWEEKTIAENIVSLQSGKSKDYEQLGQFPFYGSTGRIGYSKTYEYEGSSILIARVGANAGSLYQVENKYNVSDNTLILKLKDGVSINFINYFLVQFNLKKLIFGTGQPLVTAGTIKNISFRLPKKTEQTAIGQFFRRLDEMLTLAEQKHAQTVQLKKAMLGKLFPISGSLKPQIRLKGFSGDWVERKLGDLGEIVMGQSPDSANYTDNPNDMILVQGNADLKNGKVVPRVWTTQITKTAKKGSLLISVRAPVGDVGKTDFDIVIGRGISAIQGNEFIYQTLVKMKLDNYWTSVSAGSTFESINGDDIKNAVILCPNIAEQTAIGKLFQTLDYTIALQAKEITQIKQLKSALLGKMFV